jgi:hypothetical protein
MKRFPGQVTALAASVYRHAELWKFRAYGHAYASDRSALCSQLGIGDAWPRIVRPDTEIASPVTPAAPAFTESRPPRSRPTSVPIANPGPSSHPASRQPALPAGSPPPLDLERLSAIERDTAAVSDLLSDIFSDVKETPPRKSAPSGASGLDRDHAAVLTGLMTAGRIGTSDFAALARKHGLMPSGAVETLNDWSLDAIGDVVVSEDAGGYVIVPEHLPALRALQPAA